MIDEYIKEGKIVPVEITLALLRKAMEKETKAKGFLIDGLAFSCLHEQQT